MISTDAFLGRFPLFVLTIVNEGSSLTIVREGLSLMIVVTKGRRYNDHQRNDDFLKRLPFLKTPPESAPEYNYI